MDNNIATHTASSSFCCFFCHNARQAAQQKEAKKLQALRTTLARDPTDTIGRDPDGFLDYCRRDKGKEDLPGVSNRTSLHILTVTDDEIKDDTLKARAFIERYYQAFDSDGNKYSIWSLLADLKDKGRYRPDDFTIEELEIINRNFDKHAKQILNQLSFDAAERHAREALKRKNIGWIGMFLSMLTSLSGTVTGFLGSNNSQQNTQRLVEIGYAQIIIGIVIGSVIKMISTHVEEHNGAARNLDVTLSWAENETVRLKNELISVQEPYLAKLRCDPRKTEKPLLPIERQLLDMNYIWLKPNTASSDKSLFETIAQLQIVLFGARETADSVEAALLSFKQRAKTNSLYKKPPLLDKTTDLDALAQIFRSTILLISEALLPNNLHYQIINEPIREEHPLEIEEIVIEAADEENNLNPMKATPKLAMHYMVIYTTGTQQYQPILAPLNTTWDEVKKTLAFLPVVEETIEKISSVSLV